LHKKNTYCQEGISRIGLPLKALREPLKNLDEETAFAGMMNWIINQMPQEESIKVRFRTTSQVHQVTLFYHGRKLRAKGLEAIMKEEAEITLYDWEEETNYDNLTTEKIRQSMRNADVKNHYRHCPATNNEDIIPDFPQGNFKITEEEMELIDEFLNV